MTNDAAVPAAAAGSDAGIVMCDDDGWPYDEQLSKPPLLPEGFASMSERERHLFAQVTTTNREVSHSLVFPWTRPLVRCVQLASIQMPKPDPVAGYYTVPGGAAQHIMPPGFIAVPRGDMQQQVDYHSPDMEAMAQQQPPPDVKPDVEEFTPTAERFPESAVPEEKPDTSDTGGVSRNTPPLSSQKKEATPPPPPDAKADEESGEQVSESAAKPTATAPPPPTATASTPTPTAKVPPAIKSWAALVGSKPVDAKPSVVRSAPAPVGMMGDASGAARPVVSAAPSQEAVNLQRSLREKYQKYMSQNDLHQLGDLLIAYQPNRKQRHLKPRGMLNDNNTCYMNAVLQVLVFCPPVSQLMTTLDRHKHNPPHLNLPPGTNALTELLGNFRTGLFETYRKNEAVSRAHLQRKVHVYRSDAI